MVRRTRLNESFSLLKFALDINECAINNSGCLTRAIILTELTCAAVLTDSVWTKIDALAKANVI